MQSKRKPFFPDDKPRSWIIGLSTGMMAFLFAGAAFFAKMMALDFLADLARFFSLLFGFVMLPMMVICNFKSLSGQYKNLRPSEWKDRPW
jgi:hypothetical protein